MIPRVSLGGSRLRVRISNAYGVRPLAIGAAWVGVRSLYRGEPVAWGGSGTSENGLYVLVQMEILGGEPGDERGQVVEPKPDDHVDVAGAAGLAGSAAARPGSPSSLRATS